MKKSFWAKNSEIESDKTMDDELMYILINDKQNQPFYSMKWFNCWLHLSYSSDVKSLSLNIVIFVNLFKMNCIIISFITKDTQNKDENNH